MDGCREARAAITISEVPCPQCGTGIEIFIRDGSLAADAVCENCGYRIPAGADAREDIKTETGRQALRENQLQIAAGHRKSPGTVEIPGLFGCGGRI